MNVSPLSKEEVLRILSAARAFREDHWLAILVGYLHALRASEVVAIKAIDVQDGYLAVSRGKRSERTTQPLLTSLNPLLSEREAVIELARRGSIHPLFNWTRQTFYNVLRRHGKTAELPAHQCHPHMLKQACITHMYEKTKDLPACQKWAGHKVGSTTMIYMRRTQVQASALAQEALCV